VRNIRPRTDLTLFLLVLALDGSSAAAGTDHYGRITFSGHPVPGATVTAERGDITRVTVTDEQGIYRFTDLADGSWTVQVDMLGFETVRQEVVVSADATMPALALTMRPFEEMASRGVVQTEASPAVTTAARGGTTAPAAQGAAERPAGGFQRANVNAPAGGPARAGDATTPVSEPGTDRAADAADGFLINGSVNNGAASPFAQLAAFGNNRRGPRSLYNGGIGMMFGTSAWDARPFSFAGASTPRPVYDDAQVVASFAGPLRIPRLLRNGPNMFVGFQHSADHNATTQSALVPTAAEHQGDFSQSFDASGRPVHLVDPSTGLAFPGNVIPPSRISPQASALLALYPQPNIGGAGRFNYQTPVLVTTHQDALQTRLIETLNQRNQLFGTFSYQRTLTDAANVFGFVDSTSVSGVDVPMNWSHRFSQFFSLRLRYQYTALATDVSPYFANRQNIAGAAGITGNNQDPVNWGPPTLMFSSGIAGLASAQYASNRDRTNGWGAESLWTHGRHNVSVGGDVRLRHLDIVSQQNARGTFAFTGAAAGSDLADFLLGVPHTSSIAFGNADKYLRGSSADAYVTDDWRLSPTFTANIGMRWEYEGPFSERLNRLVNLDVAPGFTAVNPVTADVPTGSLTGRHYPASLIRPDWRGFQPRIGVTWRPVAGSSVVIRGGYGVYRNTSVYQSIDLLLAQQPPLSKALSVENTPGHPLTLANGFVAVPNVTANTFAVDPDFRVGYAHTWQVLMQRDLPWSSTVTATYLGTKGSHLPQEFLPNTYPLGAANPCPTCPAGFVYLTSNGNSTRQSGQVQLRRRLHNGLTATVQYTLSKATDDAPAAFTGASLSGASIAQDWLRLEDERGPSPFDQRHLLTAQFQYTSGVGTGGGALLEGARGSLLKGWTVTSQLTAGSGLPLTPIYLTSVAGTGVTGTIRPDVSGAHPGAAPPGSYVDPAAFVAPAAGHWGSAGRNSIRGPAQFALNASLGRSFLWGERLTLDWRIDATNVLNRVTYTGVNTFVGSPQFGLPIQANAMRKLQSSLRLRF
jgi:hypothetical protein